MRHRWSRYQKWCVALSSGGITLGIIQGFGMINWAYFFTQFLAQWLSILVTLLLGGQVNQGLGGTGTSVIGL